MTAALRAICGMLLLALASGCGEQAAPATPTAIAATATPTSVASMPTVVIDHAAPVLGVVVDRGLRVLDVVRGSSAEEIGLRAGDVVTKVGGAAVSTSADARRLFQQAKEGDRLSLTVRRGGQDLMLSFVVRGVIYQGGNSLPPTATPVPANDD
jgi:membrane-associated protease RseP (regulator of RpoE activity)